jgi:hypothetical protein
MVPEPPRLELLGSAVSLFDDNPPPVARPPVRAYWIPVVVVALLLIAVASGAGTVLSGRTAASADPDKPIGIATGDTLPWLTPTALDQELDDMGALGVTSIRLDLAWDDVQPTSSTSYNWTNFDRIVQAANARGSTLLPPLAYTPAWARPAGCSDKCPPTDPAQFGAFVSAAVQRYAPQGIHTWEIWNEPNTSGFFQPSPNVGTYVALLGVAHNAIEAADPSATILLGGLAAAQTGNGDISPSDFLTQVCQQGGISLVSGVAYHPYSEPVPPAYDASWNPWNQISNLESILSSCGAPNMKIWITEYGAPTDGPGAGATMSNYLLGQPSDHVDEPLQAEMATEAVELTRSDPAIAAMYWYSYEDLGTGQSDPENFYGLRRADGSAKPSWYAFRSAIGTQTGPFPAGFPDGYRIATSQGTTVSYGGAQTYAGPDATATVVDAAATPNQLGYWLLDKNGGVNAYGNASYHGSLNNVRLNAPVVGMASTASGNGYWILARDGGVFSYGDAQFYGSTGGIRLNKPVVGMAATPTGNGYWFVASDGGVFAYGDAQFYGSTGSLHLNEPIVGMASTPDGDGYWLVASDGGVFAFGDARYFGSTGSLHLNRPIVGIMPTADAGGYLLAGADGGVFTFGDATYAGGLGAGGSSKTAAAIFP